MVLRGAGRRQTAPSVRGGALGEGELAADGGGGGGGTAQGRVAVGAGEEAGGGAGEVDGRAVGGGGVAGVVGACK